MMVSWEYIAGFTDGEWHIGRVGRGCRITWGQNSREVLDKMAELFVSIGANPRLYEVPPKPPRRPNLSYVLHITHLKYVREVLTRIMPMLIVKRDDAKALIAWMDDNPIRANCEPVDESELRRLHAEGWTQAVIGQHMGHCTSRIGKECRRLGLEYPSGGRVVDGKHVPKSIVRCGCGVIIKPSSQRCRSCAAQHRVSA